MQVRARRGVRVLGAGQAYAVGLVQTSKPCYSLARAGMHTLLNPTNRLLTK